MKKSNRLIILIGLLLALSLATACNTPSPAPTEPAAPTDTPKPVAATDTPLSSPSPTETQTAAGMPNPASVYCEKEGGKLEIRTGTAGEAGYCIFADGSECEEWAFFRGECQPGQSKISIDDLIANLQAEFPEKAFEGLKGMPVTGLESNRTYWVVFSYGLKNYNLDPLVDHFVAIYIENGTGWQELGRLTLTTNFEAEPVDPGADYVAEGAVSQVFVEPTRIWLQVEGGIGAHGGTYHLLSFDGGTFQIELANSSPSPGAAGLADLNGDGLPEVILNATDPYVFCYACGVRKIAFRVFTWDAANERLLELSIQPMLMGQQGHPARQPNNRAAQLAEAGLWKDAVVKITEAKDAAAQTAAPTDTFVLNWNDVLINLHAQALAESVAESPYPLLNNIFYGDYAAALDLMRPFSAQELFVAGSPLIEGTVASGWEDTLNDWIAASTTAALNAQPDLAAAYFLRGWAAYLIDPGNPNILADLTRAAELNPDEALFIAGLDVVQDGASSQSFDELDAELLAGGYQTQVQEFEQDGAVYRAAIYTHEEWYDKPNWAGILPGTQDYIAKSVATGGDTTYILEISIE